MSANALPLVEGAVVERVSTGSTWSEGPLWVPSIESLIWSDIPSNRVLQYSPLTGQTSTYRDQVEFSNGRALDTDGSIITCSHGNRSVERWHKNGRVETIVDSFGKAKLNSPNDVVVHSDGSIWFTDPDYGIRQPAEGYPGIREYDACYVFRFADGELTAVVTDMNRPNGLAFSPDESVLYVSDSANALDDGPEHHIRAYSITGQTVTDGRTFAEVSPGVPDGIAIDIDGRVWSSSAQGVQVFSSTGTLLGVIEVPEVVANVTFDQDGVLYITASTSLYRIYTATRPA